jgi:hypothetical protein
VSTSGETKYRAISAGRGRQCAPRLQRAGRRVRRVELVPVDVLGCRPGWRGDAHPGSHCGRSRARDERRTLRAGGLPANRELIKQEARYHLDLLEEHGPIVVTTCSRTGDLPQGLIGLGRNPSSSPTTRSGFLGS